MLTLDVCQVDDESRLFISPAIHEWTPLESIGIDTVIDLEGDVVARLRDRRPGALFNQTFAAYLESL
jgi:hypothetical protein